MTRLILVELQADTPTWSRGSSAAEHLAHTHGGRWSESSPRNHSQHGGTMKAFLNKNKWLIIGAAACFVAGAVLL